MGIPAMILCSELPGYSGNWGYWRDLHISPHTFKSRKLLQSSQYIKLLPIPPFSCQLYHSPLHVLQLSEHQTITELSSWLESSAKGKLLFVTTSQSFDFPHNGRANRLPKAFHALHRNRFTADIRDTYWPMWLWVRWTIIHHPQGCTRHRQERRTI